MQKLKRFVTALAKLAFYAVMSSGVWLMLEASTSYLDLGEAHPFFLEKLPLAHPKLWLTALYVHVPTALFSLPACLLLVVPAFRARWPRAHRWLGRVTGAFVLLAVVPTGMYLALFAQGGWASTFGFWLTGIITFVAMVLSIRNARARNMRAHRRFSMHVLAQLSVAVSSRFMLATADELGMYDEWAYIAALWVPVIGGVLIAEWLSGTRPSLSSIRSWTWKGARNENVVSVGSLDVVRERGTRRAA